MSENTPTIIDRALQEAERRYPPARGHEGFTGNRHEWDEVSEGERHVFRNDARAAARAMGFEVPGE